MRFPRVVFVASLLAPASALAQIPTYPNVPNAPTTLDPASSGTQGPQPTQPAPAASNPGIVIVGPDGNIIGGDRAPGQDTTYYVPTGSSGQIVDDNGYTVYNGPTPDLHVVRSGDTLWDICWFYFNDPWQWPKVWSYNPQITNPHWIYPGDLVRLLPRGVFSQNARPIGPDPDPDARRVDPVPAPARRSDVGLHTMAFVEKAELEKSIVIDGAVDEKELLGTGDQVYLAYPKNKTPVVGNTYSIYEPGQPVKQGGKEYGSYVRLLGTVEVLSVKDKKLARAVITQADREIERGAKVGPIVKAFQNVDFVAPTVDAQAPIVGMLTKDQLIGEGEIVFIALGKQSGVKAGNRMFIVRRGDAKPDTMSNEIGSDDRRFPARALGEIVIVEVGANVSIGLVTLSVQEMSVGDLAMMQKASE